MSYIKGDFKDKAKKEFETIVTHYMLPLFAGHHGNLIDEPSTNDKLITIENNSGNNILKLYPCINAPFHYEAKTYPGSISQRIPTAIFQELLNAAEYKCYGNEFARRVGRFEKRKDQNSYQMRTFDLAFEVGMCTMLAGHSNALFLHSLLCKMIDWSQKTYEGKKVPFGIVIDFDKSLPATDNPASFSEFLTNNSSAIFTDGISTGILLDNHGDIISYLTLDSSLPPKSARHETFVPSSLSNLAQYCTNNSIGIVLLPTGEILLIKKQEVWFTRRGSKWVSFDWNIVHQCLRPYFKAKATANEKIIENKIKAIYCTLLDVSFAHTGGCLAISTKRRYDKRLQSLIKDGFIDYQKGRIPKEILVKSEKKLKVLMRLLNYGISSPKTFFQLDKPLRKEILSLDGATVILLNGEVYCAGSIVSVNGGSTEGGRSAAAKGLAELGVGIKVSEDGYIEAYGSNINRLEEDGKVPEIVTLFKFK